MNIRAIWLQAFTIYEELEEIMLMPIALISTGSTVSTRHLGSGSTRGASEVARSTARTVS